jgi:hypothetical protein
LRLLISAARDDRAINMTDHRTKQRLQPRITLTQPLLRGWTKIIFFIAQTFISIKPK